MYRLKRIAVAIAGLVGATLLAASCASADDPLPGLGVDLTRSSVSGLSSGAYMAGQFQVAHSSIVMGAGLVAGGPYGCAQSIAAETVPLWTTALPYNVAQALNGCMADRLRSFGVLNANTLARRAKRLAEEGRIDPIASLARDRVYLFSARGDDTVAESVVKAARDFYLAAGVPEANVTLITGAPGGHAFLTDNAGTACGLSEPPYLNDCDKDQAGEILSFIYGNLKPAAEADPASFLSFDQRPFDTDSGSAMDDSGYAYIPATCREQPGCAVHIVFHGCRQGTAEVGDVFVRQFGFAQWAEANRLVVLFPQVR